MMQQYTGVSKVALLGWGVERKAKQRERERRKETCLKKCKSTVLQQLFEMSAILFDTPLTPSSAFWKKSCFIMPHTEKSYHEIS